MEKMTEAIARYLEDCELGRKLSASTVKAYRIDLLQFSRFTGGAWGDRELLNRYVKHLNQAFAPRSVKRKLASVRAFYQEPGPGRRGSGRAHSPAAWGGAVGLAGNRP